MEKINMNDLTITSLETIACFNIRTGEWMFTLDELQNANIANTQDVLDITGKGGRLLNTIKRNKAVTITGANGLVSGGLLAAQAGSDFTSAPTRYRVPDYLTVADDAAETSYVAVGTIGNEIARIFIRNIDNTQGRVLTQGAAVEEGVFTYDPTTKAIAFFPGDLADGTNIIVWYDRLVQANVISNISDNFSQTVTMYIDAVAEDKCNNLFHLQFYIPNADLNGNFDFAMGDAQTIHNFEARSLTNTCHGTSKFWDMIIIGEDAEDIVTPPPTPPETFEPVTGITGVPTAGTVGTPLTLNGVVAPSNATNQTIVWGISDAGLTGANLVGNELTFTDEGTVVVTATITNGLTATSDFTDDFSIVVTA